mmetsp:Transcript_8936/g.19082  ORF Transcript_8936/g.19082 Transcript_8936/m.19082 type:complete len:98 (+) Transcript_8936:2466-2759(+)
MHLNHAPDEQVLRYVDLVLLAGAYLWCTFMLVLHMGNLAPAAAYCCSKWLVQYNIFNSTVGEGTKKMQPCSCMRCMFHPLLPQQMNRSSTDLLYFVG